MEDLEYIEINGHYYLAKRNENGELELVYSNQAPEDANAPGVLTRDVQTGEKGIWDSRKKKYTLTGYQYEHKNPLYKIDFKSRREARKGIKHILNKPEVYGHLTKEDLANEDVLKDLAGRTYYNWFDADAVNDVVYPTYRYVRPGHLYPVKGAYEDESNTYTVCGNSRTCGKTVHTKGLGWAEKQEFTNLAPIKSEYYYTKFKPIMEKQYAVPVPTREEEIYEYDTKTTPVSTVQSSTQTTENESSSTTTRYTRGTNKQGNNGNRSTNTSSNRNTNTVT